LLSVAGDAMPISPTRRRLLALGAVTLGASVGAPRAKTQNTELPGWSFRWDGKVPVAVADGAAVHFDSDRLTKKTVRIQISPTFAVRYDGGAYRVQVQLTDFRNIFDHPRNTKQDFFNRVDIGGRMAAIAFEEAIPAYPSNHLLHILVG